MFPGDKFPVTVGPLLRASRWRGGRWVRYVAGAQDHTVEASDGNEVAGMLLFPSEHYGMSQPGSFGIGDRLLSVGSSANYTSGQPATGVGGQNVMTMINGGTQAYFKMYETQRLVAGARTGADIVYSLNEDLKISENGLLTNDSDGDLVTAGVTTPHVVGIVSAVPAPRNLNRLCLDMKY
jgi:hypothetical protein